MANYQDYFHSTSTNLFYIFNGGGISGNGALLVGWSSTLSDTVEGAGRVTGVALSASANIDDAIFTLSSPQFRYGTDQIKFRIYGIKEGNTADFSSDPMGRTRTTAFADGTYDSSSADQSPRINVTSIVEEITTASGWSSGNAMGFLVLDNGTTHSNNTINFGACILSIRSSDLPDFTPGPYTSRVASAPPTQNFGIRISPQGIDAIQTEISKLHVFSRANILKAVRDAERGWTASSNLEKVSHGLKYAPAFLAFYKYGDKVRFSNSSNSTGGLPFTYAYTKPETIEMVLDPNASDPQSWYYYVFIDRGL